jgi:hypothetical protein
MEISVRRTLPVAPEEAFAFLSRAHNHRRLATPQVRLRALDLTQAGDLRGAVMVLRGPLWLRRLARTRVVRVSRPEYLAGTARVGWGTEVQVRWDLSGPAGTRVTDVSLTATVTRLATTERLLLAIGGRAWVRRVFAATLERLDAELGTQRSADGPVAGADGPFAGPTAGLATA